MSKNMKNLGLYLHIPYCKHKCAYCDFYSVPYNAMAKRYTDALMLQLEDYSQAASDYEVDTIFIGGGTPSIIPKKQMLGLIDSIYDNYNVLDDAEFTIEANPATADVSSLKVLNRSGVNRLSIGMQSANDSELSALGRIHDFDDFVHCYNDARKAKFDNINIDIMYGIPGQTRQSLEETLEKVIELHPEHISLYGLTLEKGTPLYQSVNEGKVVLPGEDEEYEMYCTAIEKLDVAGYAQYEISNFSRQGYQCRHNLKYWNCEEYIGFGPAAHSYFGGNRFSYKKDINAFMDALEEGGRGKDIIDENYTIKPEERIAEYIMLRLRLCEGIDIIDYQSIFGRNFEEEYGKYLQKYIENGFMYKYGSKYAFTTKGMYVSNYILSTMLDFDSETLKNIANGNDK